MGHGTASLRPATGLRPRPSLAVAAHGGTDERDHPDDGTDLSGLADADGGADGGSANDAYARCGVRLADPRADDRRADGRTVVRAFHGNAIHGRSVHGIAVDGLDGCFALLAMLSIRRLRHTGQRRTHARTQHAPEVMI